jgi:uncharacterized protein (TIGR02453 family)
LDSGKAAFRYAKLSATMISKDTITFLKNLGKNNNREWLQGHKADFEKAKEDFEGLVGDFIGRIAKFDPEVGGLLPETCIFRIYRDVRFSKDKSPYKPNFGAYISPGGRKSPAPGYYFHLEPGHSFLAAGKHNPDPAELLKIRKAIAGDTDGFVKIVNSKSFKKCFGELRGETLKTTPKGFPADHKAIEFLKLKSFMAAIEIPDDKFLVSKEFPTFVAGACKDAKPLVDFMRKALGS